MAMDLCNAFICHLRGCGQSFMAGLRACNRRIEDASEGIQLPKKRHSATEAGQFAAENEG